MIREYIRRLERDPDYPIATTGRHHDADLNKLRAEQFGHVMDYIACAESRQSSELDERPPERIELGVDCSEPLTVSLPDNVLTECE